MIKDEIEKIKKFKTLKFPDLTFENEELAEWGFENLLELDGYFAGFITNYLKNKTVDIFILGTIKKSIADAEVSLGKINNISKEDFYKYEYLKNYLNLMKDISENITVKNNS
ncbi:MAG: hypothetical protein J0H68_05840 [Sphingobacteriia bacterium]|nr:hypothetical protein [Sphingobacteriia bacterium]